MRRLDSKGSIICSGVSSILFVSYMFWYSGEHCGGSTYDFAIHILNIDGITSICLIVGAIRSIYKLFVPWMISTVFFMCLVVYLRLMQSIHSVNAVNIIFDVIIVIVEVYLCFAWYGVLMAFQQLRKVEPLLYNYLNDKTNFAYHI